MQLGPITIYALWIFIAIGFFAALLIINKLVQKNRLSIRFLSDHSLLIFFGGIIMARIIYVVRNLNLFFPDLSINSFIQTLFIWDKGLSPWGGILGILLTLAYFSYQNKEEMFKWMDIFMVGILGAISVSNIGAFFDGRNYGNETDLPWGVLIENSIFAVPIHPTQIYAAIYTAALTIVLFGFVGKRKFKFAGQASIFALLGYSFFRFLEEFLRGDESQIILGLREAQIYALIGVVVALVLLKFYKPNKQNHGDV